MDFERGNNLMLNLDHIGILKMHVFLYFILRFIWRMQLILI